MNFVEMTRAHEKEISELFVVATYNLTNMRKTYTKFIKMAETDCPGTEHQNEALAPGILLVYTFYGFGVSFHNSWSVHLCTLYFTKAKRKMWKLSVTLDLVVRKWVKLANFNWNFFIYNCVFQYFM